MVALLGGIAINGWYPAASDAQQGYIDMQVVSSNALDMKNNKKWVDALTAAGVDNVRITQSRDAAKRPTIETMEGRAGTTYNVTAILGDRNRIQLPGGTFSIHETDKLKTLLDSIKADGVDIALQPKAAFGLTIDQLEALHLTLIGTVEHETAAQTPQQLIDALRPAIRTPIIVDPLAQPILRQAGVIHNEFQGMAHGVALTATLQQIDLALVPQRKRGQAVQLVVLPVDEETESWPIGWVLVKNKRQTAPRLFDNVPVARIPNNPLDKTLQSLQRNTNTPFIYDHRSLENLEIDMSNTPVSLEIEKTTPMRILQRVIAQARPRMAIELRTDEAGAPFIWIEGRKSIVRKRKK